MLSSSMAPIDLAVLLLVNLTWGFNYVAVKIGVTAFPPVFLAGIRFCLLALMLAPLLRVSRASLPAVAAVGLTSGLLHFGLLFVGMRMADDISSVAIAIQLGVPFATILSVVLLKETIRWRRIGGIVLAFAGVVVIGFDPRVFGYLDGLLLCVGAAFCMALGMIVMRRLRGVGVFTLQGWIGLVAGPPLLVLSLLVEDGQGAAAAAAAPIAWAALAFTIFGASLIGHAGNYWLLQRHPVSLIAPLTLLAPILGVVFGVTLLHDQLTWRILIGGTMTLVGVGVILWRDRVPAETAQTT